MVVKKPGDRCMVTPVILNLEGILQGWVALEYLCMFGFRLPDQVRHMLRRNDTTAFVVIPAKAGIQSFKYVHWHVS